MVKEGTKWVGNEGREFVVIHRVELEGNIWIHYRDHQAQEYSCYEDAFLYRFRELANEKR